MDNTPISIIIPVLNNEDSIGECLSHLVAYGRGAEIIVVDGGSEDSTWRQHRNFQYGYLVVNPIARPE